MIAPRRRRSAKRGPFRLTPKKFKSARHRKVQTRDLAQEDAIFLRL